MLLESGRDLVELRVNSLVKWIERAVVERDRDSCVADFGQQLDGVEQVMVGEAVGVVGEEHDLKATIEIVLLVLLEDSSASF